MKRICLYIIAAILMASVSIAGLPHSHAYMQQTDADSIAVAANAHDHHSHDHGHSHNLKNDTAKAHDCDDEKSCHQAKAGPACCSMTAGHCSLVFVGSSSMSVPPVHDCEIGLLPGRDQLLIGQYPEAETPPPRS